MKRIPLRNHKGETIAQAIVDDGDYEYLMQWRWCRHSKGYAMRGTTGPKRKHTSILIHRVVMERMRGEPIPKNKWVDHRNGDKLDNRRSNLRLATPSQNNRNKQAVGVSPYLNVYNGDGVRKRPWRAQIKHDGNQKHLGSYPTPEAAAHAVDAYAIIHKIAAPLNFPDFWGREFGNE